MKPCLSKTAARGTSHLLYEFLIMLECKNDRNKGHVIGVCKRVCTFLWKKKLLCFAREKIGKMSVCVREREREDW